MLGFIVSRNQVLEARAESVADDAGKVNVSKTGNCVSVNAVSAIDRIDVYSIDGTQLNSTDIEGATGSFNIILIQYIIS